MDIISDKGTKYSSPVQKVTGTTINPTEKPIIISSPTPAVKTNYVFTYTKDAVILPSESLSVGNMVTAKMNIQLKRNSDTSLSLSSPLENVSWHVNFMCGSVKITELDGKGKPVIVFPAGL